MAAGFLHPAQEFPRAHILLPKAAGCGPSAVQLHVEELSSLRYMWTCAYRDTSQCLLPALSVTVQLPYTFEGFF